MQNQYITTINILNKLFLQHTPEQRCPWTSNQYLPRGSRRNPLPTKRPTQLQPYREYHSLQPATKTKSLRTTPRSQNIHKRRQHLQSLPILPLLPGNTGLLHNKSIWFLPKYNRKSTMRRHDEFPTTTRLPGHPDDNG